MIFVSLPQLLGCPLFGSNSGLFTVPGFIVSPVVIFLKRKKEEIKMERKEEGIKKERRKERKELKEKKKIVTKKRKSLLLASNWPSQFCWSSWLQQALEALVLLFSLPEPHSLFL